MRFIELRNKALLNELKYIVMQCFCEAPAYYAKLPTDEFRGIVVVAQNHMNRERLARRLAQDMEEEIKDLLKTDEVLVQTCLYLRAGRPIEDSEQDNVPWHREDFYGCPKHAFNVWIPVLGVTPENTIKYIPDSELIPDDEIVTEYHGTMGVKQFSDGHKTGLLYAPKRIVSGVDFSRAIPLIVPKDSAAVFDGNVIHGAAVNRTPNIRFSIDFRVHAKETLKDQKEYHFASGREYFVPLEAA